MADYTLDDMGVDSINETIDIVHSIAPFTHRSPLESKDVNRNSPNIHGYLMQPLSNGGSALCACTVKNRVYRSFHLNLAGIIWSSLTPTPQNVATFKLRFYRAGDIWFDTQAFTIRQLSILDLINQISLSSVDANGQPQFPTLFMTGALGHPALSAYIVDNDDLYPTVPDGYRSGDMKQALIGSWLFCIHRAKLPTRFDVKLLFDINGANPVELKGPSVMTITEVDDIPTGQFEIVHDVLNIARPTPLQGGTKIAAIPFEGTGYGVVAANPREYFFEQLTP